MAENNGMVLSRVKSAVSGDEYYIGTYGDNETLVVTLQIRGGATSRNFLGMFSIYFKVFLIFIFINLFYDH